MFENILDGISTTKLFCDNYEGITQVDKCVTLDESSIIMYSGGA